MRLESRETRLYGSRFFRRCFWAQPQHGEREHDPLQNGGWQQVRPVGLQHPLGHGSPHVEPLEPDDPPVPVDPPVPDDPPVPEEPVRVSVTLQVPSQTKLKLFPERDPVQSDEPAVSETLLPLTLPVTVMPATGSVVEMLQPACATVIVLPAYPLSQWDVYVHCPATSSHEPLPLDDEVQLKRSAVAARAAAASERSMRSGLCMVTVLPR